jgi:hypothetical protein
VHAGLAQNKIVVEVSVCGFGETGDAFNGWPHPNIGSDGHVSALAMFLGRSIPGIHAGDILRAVTYVKVYLFNGVRTCYLIDLVLLVSK